MPSNIYSLSNGIYSSVFQKLLIDDSPTNLEAPPPTPTNHVNKQHQNGSNSPSSPRTTTWGITGSILPGVTRSRKFSLKKKLRSQGSGEDDVVLSSFSGIEQNAHKNGKDVAIQQEVSALFNLHSFNKLKIEQINCK